jgi:hypothetical protein
VAQEKQLVRRELSKLKPRFNLFGANGEFNRSNWRAFKKNYNVTSATMQVLLEALGDKFFSGTKQTQNKNWSIEDLSPYAKEFFNVFLR